MTEAAPAHDSARSDRRWLLGAALVVAVAVVLLRVSGQPWWCACGSFAPWVGEAQSRHTSQHLVDPYGFTHLLHGFVLFALLSLVLRGRLGPPARLALAIAAEACWELLENSHWVIERYRAATVSLDYHGDSVGNSLGDIACCTLGALLAARLPKRASIAIVVVVELALLAAIRDNLTLNVLMLVAPSEAVKTWQRG